MQTCTNCAKKIKIEAKIPAHIAVFWESFKNWKLANIYNIERSTKNLHVTDYSSVLYNSRGLLPKLLNQKMDQFYLASFVFLLFVRLREKLLLAMAPTWESSRILKQSIITSFVLQEVRLGPLYFREISGVG